MSDQINVWEIIQALIKRWWIMFICAMIFGGASYAYSKYVQVPVYRTTGRMYIDTYADTGLEDEAVEEEMRTLGMINASQKSALTCIEVLKSNKVLAEVEESIEGKTSRKYKASSIRNMLTMSAANETEVLEIKVTVSGKNKATPKDAKIIADALMDVGKEQLVEIVGVGKAEIIDTANVPQAPIAPNIGTQTIVGAFVGMLLSAIVIVVISLMDKRIKSEADLQSFELPVLGVIPDMM